MQYLRRKVLVIPWTILKTYRRYSIGDTSVSDINNPGNIKLIIAHDALLILKVSSSTSQILFMLRCSPCLGNAILCQIDEVLKSNISHIANVVLSDEQWIQASLPVKAGGLHGYSSNLFFGSASISGI